MALINCPECGKEISDKATSCPNCGKPVRENTPPPIPEKSKKRGHGCLITVFIFVVITVGSVVLTMNLNKNIQQELSGNSDDSEYITSDEFNSIKTGMSYDEVKEIVGSSGEVTSEVELGDIKTVIITWYGNGIAGSNANVTFSNNEVIAKAQVGLK